MTAARTTAEPLEDLIEESLDEAAFLWKRWEADLGSLTRNLDQTWSWTEDRLHGALDGVRIAGQEIIRVTDAALRGEDAGLLAVAAHVLSAGSPAQAREVLGAAIREASGPGLWAMIRGIEVAELNSTFAPVTAALSAGGPEHSAALCRLKAFRRSTPGREFIVAFDSGLPALQIEALRAAATAPDESLGRFVTAGLKNESPAVRLAAIQSGIRRRLPTAWDAAARLAHERHPESGPLLTRLAMLGSEPEQRSVISALRDPALQRSALFALGHLGTPEAVEICLAGMCDPKLARSAAESYCAITGADLVRDHLAASEPAEDVSPPPFAGDALDADLVPKTHDLWPLPDVDAVRRHWESVKAQYTAGVRHLRGRPVDLNRLIDTVEHGPMLRRPDLIFELAVRTNGQYDVEPGAFARMQRLMMASGRGRLALPAGP